MRLQTDQALYTVYSGPAWGAAPRSNIVNQTGRQAVYSRGKGILGRYLVQGCTRNQKYIQNFLRFVIGGKNQPKVL